MDFRFHFDTNRGRRRILKIVVQVSRFRSRRSPSALDTPKKRPLRLSLTERGMQMSLLKEAAHNEIMYIKTKPILKPAKSATHMQRFVSRRSSLFSGTRLCRSESWWTVGGLHLGARSEVCVWLCVRFGDDEIGTWRATFMGTSLPRAQMASLWSSCLPLKIQPHATRVCCSVRASENRRQVCPY